MEDLSVETLKKNLNTRLVGREVFYYPVVDSTMIAARQMAGSSEGEGIVVVAGIQQAGRGRIQRAWASPSGSVSLSVVLRPSLEILPQMIMLAAVAVSEAIEGLTGLNPGLKWPNDVLIGGRKVSGILSESHWAGDRPDYAIIGIGLNVNIAPDDFPEEVRETATSLSQELGRGVSRLEVIRRVLEAIDFHYLGLLSGETVFELWRQRLVTLGQAVSVTSPEEVITGIAEDVSPDGSLLLRREDGQLERILAGDVRLRPR